MVPAHMALGPWLWETAAPGKATTLRQTASLASVAATKTLLSTHEQRSSTASCCLQSGRAVQIQHAASSSPSLCCGTFHAFAHGCSAVGEEQVLAVPAMKACSCALAIWRLACQASRHVAALALSCLSCASSSHPMEYQRAVCSAGYDLL